MTVCYEKLMSNLLLLPLQFLTFSLQYNIEKKIDSDDEDDDEDDDDAFSKKKNVPDDPMARKFFFVPNYYAHCYIPYLGGIP